jgi:hypothetical protein
MIKFETMVLVLADWLGACTSWEVQSASPQQVLAEHQPKKVWVTPRRQYDRRPEPARDRRRQALRDGAIAGLRRARRPEWRGCGRREPCRYPEGDPGKVGLLG